MRRAIFAVFAALLTLGTAGNASATRLITQYEGSSGGSCPCTSMQIEGLFVYLTDGIKRISGGSKQFGIDADILLGAMLPNDATSIRFDATNSPDFFDFADRLTNGINEPLRTGGYLIRSPGAVVAGGGGGYFERPIERWETDYQGLEIEFVELVFGGTSFWFDQASQRWNYEMKHTWNVYGIGRIPEPGTTALLVAGLGMVGLFSRLRRQKPA